MFLAFVWWDVSPEIFSFLPIRWYGTLFAIGFLVAHRLSIFLYKKEGYPAEWVDTLLTYTVIATIIGARLGHVIFYDPAYYFSHPIEILKIWEGGLASHGATLALLFAMYLYGKRVTKKPFLWGVDRVVIVIALVAFCIRLGNLFNSEIVGMPSKNPTAFIFAYPVKEAMLTHLEGKIDNISYLAEPQDTTIDGIYLKKAQMQLTLNDKFPISDAKKVSQLKQDVGQILRYYSDKEENHIVYLQDEITLNKTTDKKNQLQVEVWGKPRLPAQLFEALFYLCVFFITYFGFTKKNWGKKIGLTSGVFLILVFGFRFFVEYFKEVQEAWERGLLLKQGQMLSIPFVILGLVFIFLAQKRTKHE